MIETYNVNVDATVSKNAHASGKIVHNSVDIVVSSYERAEDEKQHANWLEMIYPELPITMVNVFNSYGSHLFTLIVAKALTIIEVAEFAQYNCVRASYANIAK